MNHIPRAEAEDLAARVAQLEGQVRGGRQPMGGSAAAAAVPPTPH